MVLARTKALAKLSSVFFLVIVFPSDSARGYVL
jgi:hypothetical protein